MHDLPRHELHHADGRRLLVYGGPSGFLDGEPAPDEAPTTHERLDVFTRAWVGIAPARNARPLDSVAETAEQCPFCPGGSEVPFPYPTPPQPPPLVGPTESARGKCEVVLYTHRHEASFGALSAIELCRVVAVWIDRARELWSDTARSYVCVFENPGSEVGATIAHPHGQIHALDRVPPIAAAKAAAHRRHRDQVGRCLSCDATLSDARSDRIVSENESFVVAVPFAARWPFEVAIRARRHGLKAPADEPDWHLAFELYPLHRASRTAKIRASVETGLGLFLNDVAPEEAARRLTRLTVPAEPIELDTLFVVARPEVAATP